MEDVRGTVAWVARHASHMKVDFSGPELRELLNWPHKLPLEDERVRLLHEVGLEQERSFQGEAANLVKSCGNSAVTLVTLVARHFPGPELHELLNWPHTLPLEVEGVRLLHEVGLEQERSFQGEAANLVKSCGNSTVTLVALVTRHFPGAECGDALIIFMLIQNHQSGPDTVDGLSLK